MALNHYGAQFFYFLTISAVLKALIYGARCVMTYSVNVCSIHEVCMEVFAIQ